MDFDDILVRETGAITEVTLNRPERRNALSLDLMRELQAALEHAGGRVIVIAGAGPCFSSGHDLAEMIDREPAFYDELFGACTSLMETIPRVPQPVIAKVHGVATAAGCQLVASCDLAVATSEARFATPGVKIGLFCSTPMVPLSRAIGRKRSLEMLLTGAFVDAATAAEWGLVNRVVDADQLDDAVLDLAAAIAAASAETVAIGKAAFHKQIDLDMAGAYGLATGVMAGNATTPDAQEGMSAFLDKRPPVWATT
jgi:enoyl-CoA hydratase/carnithine racemase